MNLAVFICCRSLDPFGKQMKLTTCCFLEFFFRFPELITSGGEWQTEVIDEVFTD